jgi:hypothetical protein
MARDGLIEDQIAGIVGIHKNILRAQYIEDIKQGKAARAAAKEALSAMTPEEYHFLIAATASFSSDWCDPAYGNDLFQGMDINKAFAFWKKQQGGKYICIGLSSRIDPRKAAEFSKIVANYQQSALAVKGET